MNATAKHWTLRIVATNLGQVFSESIYVESYKPASMDQYGRYRKDGFLTVTLDRAKAMHFDSAADALEFWKQSNGYRPDGEANRPLASYTCEIEEAV